MKFRNSTDRKVQEYELLFEGNNFYLEKIYKPAKKAKITRGT